MNTRIVQAPIAALVTVAVIGGAALAGDTQKSSASTTEGSARYGYVVGGELITPPSVPAVLESEDGGVVGETRYGYVVGGELVKREG